MPFNFFLRLVPAALAFAAGFKATDWVFRRELIPYPFELFGVLTGLGLASWALAVLSLTTKRRIR